MAVDPNLLKLVRDLWGDGFSISRWFLPGHDGVDLPAKTGTPVRAVASGTVSFAKDARLLSSSEAGKGWAIGGGKVVNVDVGDKLTAQYAHLDSIMVKEGQYVTKGQIIGTVGNTGGMLANGSQGGAGSAFYGPHLHFGLWDRKANKMVNPTSWLMAQRAGLGGSWYDSKATGALGAWGDIVKFPVGHVITEADIDTMMTALQAGGFFKDDIGGQAYTKTREILMRDALGQQWNKSLQDKLQASLNSAAIESNALGAAAGSLVTFLAKLTDPANWVRILALIAGAIIAAYGGINVLRATASPSYA